MRPHYKSLQPAILTPVPQIELLAINVNVSLAYYPRNLRLHHSAIFRLTPAWKSAARGVRARPHTYQVHILAHHPLASHVLTDLIMPRSG